jgi:hypothetical protein
LSVKGATQAIGAGVATANVVGVFSGTYQVGISPGWVTGYDVTAKTAAGFTVNFANPAPAGGSTFDWLVNDTALPTTTALSGATQAVAAGIATAAIVPAASLPASYQVAWSASWVTGGDVVNKTAGGFTINFANPAPPGGGNVDWFVFTPTVGTVSLADYLDELNDLLHDPNNRFWSNTNPQQKANYINRAIRRRDIDTGANRQLLTFVLTPGTGTYTLAQVGNGQAFDLYSINLFFGATRILLQNLPKTELDMKYRPWTTYTAIPEAFARFGPSTVIFGPTPNTAFTTEWDCAVYSSPLINLTDTDVLPYPYTQPVPYYAAYLAKMNMQKDDEAQEFLTRYEQQLGIATNARVGRVPNQYTGLQMMR